MELWIRSQDRRCLTKVQYLYIHKEYDNLKSCNVYEIKQENDIILGEYSTEEKALEVLNEIQGIIHPKLICTGDFTSDITDQLMSDKCNGIFYDDTKMKFEQLKIYVYNMPKVIL